MNISCLSLLEKRFLGIRCSFSFLLEFNVSFVCKSFDIVYAQVNIFLSTFIISVTYCSIKWFVIVYIRQCILFLFMYLTFHVSKV